MQDIQYTLLSIRCLIHSDRMRTDAISESMIQVLYCRAVSCCEMCCIGYSLFDNLVCSLFVHVGVLCCFALFVCLTLLASFFLPSHLSLKTCTVQYCSHYSLIFCLELLLYKEWQHHYYNAPQYRTCIMDSDMASVLIRSLCIKHLILNNVYCMSCMILSHVVFMQSLYPHF